MDGGTTWTTSFTAVQGENNVLVRQTDTAGNVSQSTPFSFTLDTAVAAVSQVTLPDAGTYVAGQVIQVAVKYAKPVFVTGSGLTAPYVSVTVGSVVRKAVYVSGSGTDTLVFAYTLVSGDRAPNGVTFAASITVPTGGAITDRAGNSASRTLTLPSPLPRIVV